METLVLKAFTIIFRAVGIMLLMGTLVSVLASFQKLAFESKRRGLVSLSNINMQLVGEKGSITTPKTNYRIQK